MTAKQIVPGVYAISLGIVNTFLIDGDGLTLIDTGVPGSAPKILEAVRGLGRRSEEIRRIVVTHLHADHSGSLRVLKDQTGAQAYMHPVDAAAVRIGQASRPVQPAPGLVNTLLSQFILPRRKGPVTVERAEIEHEIKDGDELPFAGGLRVVGAPGHAAGQIALLWPHQGGLLFAADTCGNMFGLGYAPIYEDFRAGQATLGKLAALDFNVACFGHGRAIVSGAADRFRAKWGRLAATQSHA